MPKRFDATTGAYKGLAWGANRGGGSTAATGIVYPGNSPDRQVDRGRAWEGTHFGRLMAGPSKGWPKRMEFADGKLFAGRTDTTSSIMSIDQNDLRTGVFEAALPTGGEILNFSRLRSPRRRWPWDRARWGWFGAAGRAEPGRRPRGGLSAAGGRRSASGESRPKDLSRVRRAHG